MPDTDRSALMDKIVALCKRKGFIFQNSEIYGGQNGFWDYGPLGVELKRNVREAWWRDMVTLHDPLSAPAGAPSAFQMVGVETSIIMHPQVWKCSGHFDLFADKMVDCRECKLRFRSDHLRVQFFTDENGDVLAGCAYTDASEELRMTKAKLGHLAKEADKVASDTNRSRAQKTHLGNGPRDLSLPEYLAVVADQHSGKVPEDLFPFCPRRDCNVSAPGHLTEPRDFNLMFETHIGALQSDENKAFLRPETAQGMFTNFKNIVDSSRVKVPFGVAQIGKSFRNEITPRNFTFRSREFEQMEMEFFCPPDESRKWYEYWRDRRYNWYVSLGIESDNLILRDHEADELSHYSVGTADVEYQFPFLPEGEYGELEGIAHRGDFDLRSHMEGKLVKDENGCLVVEMNEQGQPKYKGSGRDMTYFEDDAFERDKESLGVTSFKKYCEQRKDEADPGAPYRYIPHVIEPAAGADRATLAFLCEAYHEDQQPDEKGNPQSRVVMRLHPRLAPVKVAVLPLIKKAGMPEKAQQLFRDLKAAGIAAQYDEQSAIGRRYRRQDEIGTPWCVTIDGQTVEDDGTVTLRDRDTLEQVRVPLGEVVEEIGRRLRA